MKTKQIIISELVEDFDLYPRASVDSGHVSHIAEAIEAGVEMPNIIADAATLRIVDGFHRARAFKRVHGEDHKVTVELRSYGSEGDLFLDAMRLNSHHGRNMTSYDRTHSILKAIKFEIDPKQIASALNMTVDRVAEFKTDRACKMEGSRRLVPLKMPVRHMAGKTLTKEQAEVMPKLGGNNAMFYVNQLIHLIESDMIETDNEPLMERLEKLRELLENVAVAK